MRALSGKELIQFIERHGWVLLRIHGSHHIYGKPSSEVRLSVPVHGNRPLKGRTTAASTQNRGRVGARAHLTLSTPSPRSLMPPPRPSTAYGIALPQIRHRSCGPALSEPGAIRKASADFWDCDQGPRGRLSPRRQRLHSSAAPRPATRAPERTSPEARHISANPECRSPRATG